MTGEKNSTERAIVNNIEYGPRTVLLSMPFQPLDRPSLELGLLTSILSDAGLDVCPLSLNLVFFEFCSSLPEGRGISEGDYRWLSASFRNPGAHWLFSGPPLGGALTQTEVDEFFQNLLEHPGSHPRGHESLLAWYNRLLRLRKHIPQFLRSCAEDILETKPAVVGLSCSSVQLIPSLAMAKELKTRDQALKILLTGEAISGERGESVARSFPFLDIVVPGEVEEVLPWIIDDLVRGSKPRVVEEGQNAVSLTKLPLPDFGEYFSRLEHSTLFRGTEPTIPYELARGCPAGHGGGCDCLRHSLRPTAFRVRDPGQVFDEICALSRRYKRLSFSFHGADKRGLPAALPEFIEAGYDFDFWTELPGPLDRSEVRRLRDAGFRSFRLGFKSLSSRILAASGSKCSALDVIRTLKWAAHYRVGLGWSFIFGFSGEDPAEYSRMAELTPSLRHLQAPRLWGPLEVDWYSPFWREPERFDLRLTGPPPVYDLLFEDLPADDRAALASHLDHRPCTPAEDQSYLVEFAGVVARWYSCWQGDYRQLYYRRGPGFIKVYDGRSGAQTTTHTLVGVQSRVFLGCNHGASPEQIWHSLETENQKKMSKVNIQEFLMQLVGLGLAYEEDGIFLSLPVPVRDFD